ERAATRHDATTGPNPLTTLMRTLAARGGGPEVLASRFAQWTTIQVPGDADAERLERALRRVVERHDLLRARLVIPVDAEPYLEVAESAHTHTLLRRVDAAACATAPRRVAELDELKELAHSEARATAATLDPRTGNVLRAIWLDRGRDLPGRLLLVVHHLVFDAVSWQILLGDLATAWTAPETPLPPVPTSFRTHVLAMAALSAEPMSDAGHRA